MIVLPTKVPFFVSIFKEMLRTVASPEPLGDMTPSISHFFDKTTFPALSVQTKDPIFSPSSFELSQPFSSNFARESAREVFNCF